MDPFYYLGLDCNVKDDEDNQLDVYELDVTMYPDGSWDISVGDYSGYIIYNNSNYRCLDFNNSTKELTCYINDERTEKRVYKLAMVNIT